MALEVWRAGSGAVAAKEPGSGEREAEAPSGGRHAGLDAQGDAGEKLLTPMSRSEGVDWAIEERGHSQRRACSLVQFCERVEPRTLTFIDLSLLHSGIDSRAVTH